MRKIYTHLSHFERGRIFEWRQYDRLSIREIARRLDRSHTTISRELRRNISTNYVPTYYPNIAQCKANYRLSHRAKRYRLKTPQAREYVIDRLKVGWSPEIISGRLHYDLTLPKLSHESIYQYIYKESPDLIKYLPRHHKRRRKRIPYRKARSMIYKKTLITERPDKINNRNEFGHWESDSIESADRQHGLNVLVERVSRLTHISKLVSKKSCQTKKAIINRLSNHPPALVKSITYDNGTENARHLEINNTLNTNSYFCLPYHSWEKGAVEQINSLIRRFIPKKTDISDISGLEIYKIEKLLNNRPRKCLNFKTPYEVFRKQRGALPI